MRVERVEGRNVQRLRVTEVPEMSGEQVFVIAATEDVLRSLAGAAANAAGKSRQVAKVTGFKDGKRVSLVLYREEDN